MSVNVHAPTLNELKKEWMKEFELKLFEKYGDKFKFDGKCKGNPTYTNFCRSCWR